MDRITIPESNFEDFEDADEYNDMPGLEDIVYLDRVNVFMTESDYRSGIWYLLITPWTLQRNVSLSEATV